MFRLSRTFAQRGVKLAAQPVAAVASKGVFGSRQSVRTNMTELFKPTAKTRAMLEEIARDMIEAKRAEEAAKPLAERWKVDNPDEQFEVGKNEDEIAAEEALQAKNLPEAYGLSDQAGAIGSAGIMEKYGLWTVTGMGLVAALSKELIMLDEEVLILGTFTTTVAALWLNLREGFNDMLEEESKAMWDEHFKLYDTSIERAQALIDFCEENVRVHEESAEVVEYYRVLRNNLRAAYNMRQKAFVKQQLEQQLNKLATFQENKSSLEVRSFLENAPQFVRSELRALSKKDKDAVVDAALDTIEGKKPPKGKSARAIALDLFIKHLDDVKKNDKTGQTVKVSEDEWQAARTRQHAAYQAIIDQVKEHADKVDPAWFEMMEKNRPRDPPREYVVGERMWTHPDESHPVGAIEAHTPTQ
eukprot:TRINITY_DN84844_c0_g1_i1.p2 TRINITY_DN84844_c0_g1~~TRINITY_DN84844_c0_g1_i1.p2  ORF type:complete len:448 (+),score=282.93 TRINITY_DN84844_c0_g1_i1:102-1346(+)